MRRSPLLPIFLIVLVDILGLTIVIPLLAPYAETFDASPLTATLLVSSYAVCQLVSGPLLGRISDRTGRRPMLIVSQLGTFIGFVLMARAQSLTMLFVARAIDGATAGNLSLAQAYIADNTKPEERSRSFALIGIAFGLGFFVGPGITSLLSGLGLAAPFWAAAGLSLTSVLCTTFLLPQELPPGELERAAGRASGASGPGGDRLGLLDWSVYAVYFRQPVLRGLLLQFFAYLFAFSTFLGGFTLFAERAFHWRGHPFTPREIGMVFAFSGLLGIVFQGGLVGRLVRRFGERRLVLSGFASLVVGYVLLAFSRENFVLLALASTSAAFGNAVARPTLTSLITQSTSRSEQGVVLGLTQSLASVAQISAPPLAGWLIERHLLSPWAWTAAIAAAAGLLLAPLGSGRTGAAPSPSA